jgi:type I restriction enzyme, S subunit
MPSAEEAPEGIPEGWAEARVSDLMDLINGLAFKPAQWKGHGLPIIRIQNLNNPDAPFNRCPDDLPPKFRARHGDLLFAWSGTPGTSFGAHIWYGGDAWVNQHIFRVDFDESKLDKRYLRHAINLNLRDYIEQAHGGVGLAHITKGKFEASSLLVPPLAEQRRIADAVEALLARVDAAREKLDRGPAILKRFRQAVLAAACSGRLTEDWRASRSHSTSSAARDDTQAGQQDALPNSWEWSNLARLKSFSLYGPRFSSDDYAADGQLVLRTSDIDEHGRVNLSTAPRLQLSPSEFKKYRVLRGDILITRTGSIGTLAVFNDEVEAIPGAYLIQYRLSAPLATSLYLLRFFKSPVGQASLTGGSAGIGRPNLNAPTIDHIPIPLPPRDEQEEIIRRVDALFVLADAVERRVTTARAQADSLPRTILARAFSGRLVSTEAELARREGREYEPAATLLERIRHQRETNRVAPARRGAGGRRRRSS